MSGLFFIEAGGPGTFHSPLKTCEGKHKEFMRNVNVGSGK